jgi:hypothetical protein
MEFHSEKFLKVQINFGDEIEFALYIHNNGTLLNCMKATFMFQSYVRKKQNKK